jgi:hypothetical protein
MKTKAMQVVEEDFIALYGEEALTDAKKRIAYGKSLCTKGEHKFTFKIINPANVSVPFLCEQATDHNYTGKAKGPIREQIDHRDAVRPLRLRDSKEKTSKF